MAYRDNVPKINSYSLTDFHDFDECRFRFLVRHHLDKKYQIAKGSNQLAVGVLLDRAIKEIHKFRHNGAYQAPLERLVKSIRYSADLIRQEEQSKKRPNFNSAVVPFLTDEVIEVCEGLFRNFHNQIKGNFQKAIIDIKFCKWYLKSDDSEYILWGGPDTIEMGEDGLPEIIDYKSRQNIGRGKEKMDMDLMPKMYTLLVAEELLKAGYKKARFKVIFWQDPLDKNFVEEFDLEKIAELEPLFREKIGKILELKEFDYCGSQYCDACNYEDRELFVQELAEKGYLLSTKTE